MIAASGRDLALDLSARASDWIEDHYLDLISHPEALGRLYRLPYALARAGRLDSAQKAFEALDACVLDPAGDLAPGSMRDRFTSRWASYPLTILASGAHAVGHEGRAQTIFDAVARNLVAADSGGLYGERAECRRSSRQDLFPTAQYGLTAIELGRREAAHTAGRWITQWWRIQPDLASAIYLSTDGNRLIVKDAPDRQGEAGSVLDFGTPGQPLASLGIAAAFMAQLGSEDSSALAVAMEIQSQYDRTPAWAWDPQISVQLCKRAWGASQLLIATGDERYRQQLEEMLSWFESGVSEEGFWRAPSHLSSSRSRIESDAVNAEITLEFIQHLTTIVHALSLDSKMKGRSEGT